MHILCINPSLVPRRSKKKKRRRAPVIHWSHMCGSPGFWGELGNYCDTSPCYTTVHYWITRVVPSTCSLVHSTKVCHVTSGKVRKPRMACTEGRTTDGSTARLYCKDMFVWLPTDTASRYVWVLLFVLVPHIHFGKAEVAITITDLQAMFLHGVAAHCNRIFYQNSYLCYYLWVQLTYLNEWYRECSGTARTCVLGTPLRFF